MEKKITYVTPEQAKKFARSFGERFPVSMNMLAGNEEKAKEIAKEKNDAGES